MLVCGGGGGGGGVSDLAAGYLANHTELMLVPLKKTNPGDYDYGGGVRWQREGFPLLCLFV